MDRYALPRPQQVEEDSWEAIESHRARLVGAIERDDRPAILGGSKDLVECVARVVLVSTGTALGNDDFPPLLDKAQAALKMRPKDLDSEGFARVIAQSAVTMIKKVNEHRNTAGTGHGRVRLADIGRPATSAVIDATFLWCRWALELLDPLLNSKANALIAAVLGGSPRKTLYEALDRVDIPNQEPPDQHAIGVAFGQKATTGFINAYVVGIEPAEQTSSLERWPAEYRRGVAQGLLLDFEGRIGLTPRTAKHLVRILQPLSHEQLRETFAQLTEDATGTAWAGDWEDDVRMNETVAELRAQAARLIGSVTDAVEALCMMLTRPW